jgi:hypothetical protein
MVYFTLTLWLFRGRNCGYGQVMTKLADGLYHQRNAADLLERPLDPDDWVDAGNGRRWRQPDISNLSRGRGRHGPGPLHNLFLQVKGPIGEEGDPGVLCCGLRVISVDGSVTDVPDSKTNTGSLRPSVQPDPRRRVRPGHVGRGSRVRDGEPDRRRDRPLHYGRADPRP